MNSSDSNISNFKKNIQLLLEGLNSLRTNYNFLKKHNFKDPIPSDFLQTIANTKNQIDKTLAECENPYRIIDVKKKLRRRLKKRKNIKENLKKAQNLKLIRLKLHKKIDKSLDIFKKNNTEFLARKHASEHTKIILTEINQKQIEALKYIKLFKSLNEFRVLRKQNDRLPDPNEKIWYEKINQLLSLWVDILEEYRKEESNLKLILAYNSKSLEDQWREVLFGDMECTDKNITKFTSLNQFFDIRRNWDSYIIPDNITGFGSSIPYGWVLPPDIPSEKWIAYMFK